MFGIKSSGSFVNEKTPMTSMATKIIAAAMGRFTPNSGSFIGLLLHNVHLRAVAELVLAIYYDGVAALDLIALYVDPAVLDLATLYGDAAHGRAIFVELEDKLLSCTC